MHSVGPESTTANADPAEAPKRRDSSVQEQLEESHVTETGENSSANQTTSTNVIPTSPQYGVAIIPATTALDVVAEVTTVSTDTLTETTAKSTDFNHKDMHSTPSRNDRFKVVKIASLEPFRRGRWKCMDFVDQTPQTTSTPTKSTQSQGNVQMTGVYMQTQSLPQQHIQQMLIQGGYPTAAQYYQNIPNQVPPQTQYFYTSQNIPNLQPQSFPQQLISTGVPQNNIQTQFVNTSQSFFPQNMIPNSTVFTLPNFQGVHYVTSNQGSAFVPTTQTVVPQLPPNFQQSQTYAGAPSVSQSNVPPVVNGHAFPQNEQQVTANSLPTQAAKNLLNSNVQQSMSQSQINPTQTLSQSQIQPNLTVQNNHQSQPINIANIQNSQFTQLQGQSFPQQNVVVLGQISHINQQNHPTLNQIQHSLSHMQSAPPTMVSIPPNVTQNINTQNIDPNLTTNVYTNPQFVASVNSVSNTENEGANSESHAESANADENPSGDDSSKANPVVNAIDNKIEQAMDLVKSHLMYTVREEVEVLKEKIAELMERIQQLETENNFLRAQLPKTSTANNSTEPPTQ